MIRHARGRGRGFATAAVLALAVVALTGGGGPLGIGRAADASLSAQVGNPSNLFATTSLPQPVIVSSHATVNAGYVTVSWTPTNSFATSYDVQRSTSGS